jgi:UDP-glucose 4-epimerase
MRYVVTGGCGFIGSHLVHHLVREGAEVVVVDDLSNGVRDKIPKHVELVVEDILSPGVMSRVLQGADGCFHLAAIASVARCHKEWFRTTQVNMLGTVAVFDAARQVLPAPVPVVYASSAAVYGSVERLPIDESMVPQPISAYGLDKLSCEHYGKIAWHNHGVPNIGLRFFNVYGPGQSPDSPYSGVISLFIHAALQTGEITVFGDGEQTRDFIFVENVVHALIAAMQHPNKSADVFNVCSQDATSINQLIAVIGEQTGIPLRVKHAPARVGDIRHSLGACGKLNATLPIPPLTRLPMGLRQTIVGMAGDDAVSA